MNKGLSFGRVVGDNCGAPKRDKAAALKLLKRIMKKFGRPRTVVTDRLRAGAPLRLKRRLDGGRVVLRVEEPPLL